MSWSKETVLVRIREVGLIPIIRTISADDALCAAEAIVAAGIGIVEITMNVPNAAEVVDRLMRRYGDAVLLGAGTVLDAHTCSCALDAGAEFIVTPAVVPAVIDAVRGADKVCIPGALTPTEVLTAWRAGADMVKVFPCGPVGGAQYIKVLRGPFPQIDFVPTGGITLETVAEFFKAGVAAVGIGSELVDPRALRERQLDIITATARRFLEAVRLARAVPR
jgi:2-dehydro-3-deoxyphosphogluconate aldolase/(4S)-4-hydroxy-2-oxoglutarate aldolase